MIQVLCDVCSRELPDDLAEMANRNRAAKMTKQYVRYGNADFHVNAEISLINAVSTELCIDCRTKIIEIAFAPKDKELDGGSND